MPKEKKSQTVFNRRPAKANPSSWKSGAKRSKAVFQKKGPK